MRVLRIVLACLALWLPARVAGAALGPSDAVVMIANAPPSVEDARRNATPRNSVRAPRESRRHDVARAHGTTSSIRLAPPRKVRYGKAAHRVRRAPLYLFHCALLR